MISGAGVLFRRRSIQQLAARSDARTCNQTVMSGGIKMYFVDSAEFSFEADRLRCGLMGLFLVRNRRGPSSPNWTGRRCTVNSGANFFSCRSFGNGLRFWRGSGSGLRANAHGGPFWMIDFERICLSHQIAQLAKAKCSGIEVGREVSQLFSNFSQRHPPVFALHLCDDLLNDGRGFAERLKRL